MANETVLKHLNTALQMELTAAHQYQLHAHVLDDWGIDRLAAKMREEFAEETVHSNRFLERIFDLGGEPEMAFAKRRSSDENVVIIDADGVPTIELYNDKDAWQLMNTNLGDNWFVLESNEADCQMTLYYDDPINQAVKDQGFFKKLFTFESSYIDRSGQYVLTCLKLPQKQQIWIQTLDFKAPSAFVVDDLFSHLFDAATATDQSNP